LIDELRWKKFQVLDKGYVCLVDAMGTDHEICEAARVSYGEGTKSVSDDRTLIRYLLRHRHTTPFEMAEVKLLIQMPMDCHRQQIRHRTASVNEYSTRYSEAIDERQETPPDQWRLQSGSNKQGSGGLLDEKNSKTLTAHEQELHQMAMAVYQERIGFNVAREQARKDLPLSTYTRYYWKMDLHNLLHYLGLRMDSHAQQEIRAYATIIGEEIVAKLFPLTWEAFLDYQLNAMTLSAFEIAKIKNAFRGALLPVQTWQNLSANKRECEEFKAKLVTLGFNV
jgi:thymidylate synthase (FAD)